MQVVRPVSIVFHLTIGTVLGVATGIIGRQFVPEHGVWLGVIPVIVMMLVAGRSPVRRWFIVRQPFPDRWRDWLVDHIPYYERLPTTRQTRFERDMQIFLSEQTIEGVSGVTITEEHRLSIGASAAMLLNGRPAWELPGNHSFLLYPAHFNEEYLFADDQTDAYLLGRAHGQGPVILALPAVEEAIRHPEDGRNVILHELTHLLDFANLPAASATDRNSGLSTRELKELLDREKSRIDRGESLLGSYAGTNPAEFLAVATERFFEQPRLLKRRHPQLYQLLCTVYNQDPVSPGTGVSPPSS
jgi:Mlc titration factor MtfA (ptsG expression regulator)